MEQSNFVISIKYTIYLLLINLLYSSVSILAKYASLQDIGSSSFVYSVCSSICVMGIYALLWQQLLKIVDVSLAYMFKGTTIIFTMLFAYWLFGEQITWNNIVGVFIIIVGIVLFAYNPKSVSE